uniref:Uncharacterized protein n=1 Tax=Lepeophtheirus salmonis TaxID=72036 RepID=A0A0K2UDV3_LEPSM|nr:uncharacterized protein LOC121122016 isoform X1 [Lepeophtheirus salmonis]
MSFKVIALFLIASLLTPTSRGLPYPSFENRRIDRVEHNNDETKEDQNEGHIILVEELIADDRRATYAINRRNKLHDLRKFYPNVSEKELIIMLLSRRPLKRSIHRAQILVNPSQHPKLVFHNANSNKPS